MQHTALLVHVYALSRVEFCASLWIGLTKKKQMELQRIIHYAARLTYRLKKRDSVADILLQNQWLPIHQ